MGPPAWGPEVVICVQTGTVLMRRVATTQTGLYVSKRPGPNSRSLQAALAGAVSGSVNTCPMVSQCIRSREWLMGRAGTMTKDE